MKFARDISRISFADAYRFAVGAITGTDRKSYNDFIGQARSYKRQVIDYLAGKDAFSTRAWFSSDKGKADFADLPVFHPSRFSNTSLNHSPERVSGDIYSF